MERIQSNPGGARETVRESMAGAVSTLAIGPLKVRVRRWTIAERKEALALLREIVPRPLREFTDRLREVREFPEAVKEIVSARAEAAYVADREWPPQWCSDGFLKAVHEYLPDVLMIALRSENPGLTVDTLAGAVAEDAEGASAVLVRWLFGAIDEDLKAAIRALSGEAPPAEGRAPFDPTPCATPGSSGS